jgi:hypothetical protein
MHAPYQSRLSSMSMSKNRVEGFVDISNATKWKNEHMGLAHLGIQEWIQAHVHMWGIEV